MPPKSRKFAPSEIAAFEATRDIGAEIIQSIKDMKAGKGKLVVQAMVAAHEMPGLAPNANIGGAVPPPCPVP